tara:strand:- start:336 stop:1250 length:915 start_codon:yes stop_codon:yes gene_type:complete
MKLTEAKLKKLILEMIDKDDNTIVEPEPEEPEGLSETEIDNLLEIAEADPEHGVFILESMLSEISEEQLEQIKSKLVRPLWRKGMLEAALRFMFSDKEHPGYYESHEPEKLNSPLNSMRLKNSDIARELLEKYEIYYDVMRDSNRIEIGDIVGYRDDIFYQIKRFFDLELDKQRYTFIVTKFETKSNGMVIEEGHISKKSYKGDTRELRVEVDFAYLTYPDSDERKMEKLDLKVTTTHEKYQRRTVATFGAGHGGPYNERRKGDVGYYIRFGLYAGKQDHGGTTSSVQVPILIENTFSEAGWRL